MTTPSQYVDQLQWRYACKKFDATAQLSSDEVTALREALHLSPSSLGLQLWHFIEVDTPEVRQRLKEVSWNQSQITDAAKLFVFCVRRDVTEADLDKHIAEMVKVRGGSAEALEPYKQRMGSLIFSKNDTEKQAWLERQVYIALGFLMSAASNLGIDTCAIEGMEPDKYDTILGLQESPYRTLCALAVGHRSADDAYAAQLKVRYPLDEVLTHL
jgi:nitroreductase/dihydropteridine reductase